MMRFEGRIRWVAWPAACTVVVAAALCAGPGVQADVIHLTAGGTVEGVVVEDGGDMLRLRTPSGVLGIPRRVIAAKVPGPTRWTRYQREKSGSPLTAVRHVEVARWCVENGLPRHRQEHLREALALDPTCAEALLEAGYLPVGEVWIKAASPPAPEQLEQAAVTRRERNRRIVEQLLRGWRLRIRALYEAHLKGGGGRSSSRGGLAEGRRRLWALDDPLVLPAACGVLSDRDSRSSAAGRLLVELLGESETDTAILNLLALGLLDEEETIRAAAAEALAEREDPGIARQLRSALACRNDRLVRRAAKALGLMRDRSAVPELIEALHVPRPSPQAPDVKQVFEAATAAFAEPIIVPIGEDGAAYPSSVAVIALERVISGRVSKGRARSGAPRTEVQEALIAITGQNHGFNEAAWRAWLRANPPPSQVEP